MKYGMPTLIELETLEENIALCKSLALDFIEINLNMPQFQPHLLSAERLKHLAQEHDIFFTFHLAEDIDIAHFNDTLREAFTKVTLESIELIKAMGSPVLNMHMLKGIHFTLPTGKVYLYDQYREAYFKNIDAFRLAATTALRGSDAKLYIENTGDYKHGFMREAVERLLESDVFALTYDIGHNHINEDSDEGFLLKHEARIKHYHIHDATRAQDHLRLFDGELDVLRFLHQADAMGARCVIEVKTVAALKASIESLEAKKIAS